MEEYYVAYLDILGTRKAVANDDNNNYLTTLKEIYNKTLVHKKYITNTNKLFTKIFSDNIVVAVPFNKENDLLGYLINFLALIQLFALEQGLLIRGAITKGKFFYDDVFVYGQALVEAVNLEEKSAIYPRIILQDKK